MRTRNSIFSALIAALLAMPVAVAAGQGAKENLVFRVMTFNIRFDFPNDGANRWDNRVSLVTGAIKAEKASVVCLQEDKVEQIQDLRKAMPGWDFVGKGRNGNGSGETCSVAFDSAQWRCIESGDLALSSTPETLGSNDWGTKYPHKVTWARLENLKDTKHRKVVFMSTHFDEHRGDSADQVRSKSAKVIRNFVDKNAAKGNFVICGDFNAGPDEEAHAALMGGTPRIQDAWEFMRPGDGAPGTVHDFKGGKNTRRIDWILFAGNVTPREAHVVRWNKDGRYPSDHYPVSSEVSVSGDAAEKAEKTEKSDKSSSSKEPKVEPRLPDGPPPVSPE